MRIRLRLCTAELRPELRLPPVPRPRACAGELEVWIAGAQLRKGDRCIVETYEFGGLRSHGQRVSAKERAM